MDKSNELFELMTKMYSDMQEGFSNVNKRIDKVENEVIKTNITIENDVKPKIEALFDGYKQNTEVINELADKVDDLQTDINNLTIRTLKNENNIISFSKSIKNNTSNKDAQ